MCSLDINKFKWKRKLEERFSREDFGWFFFFFLAASQFSPLVVSFKVEFWTGDSRKTERQS